MNARSPPHLFLWCVLGWCCLDPGPGPIVRCNLPSAQHPTISRYGEAAAGIYTPPPYLYIYAGYLLSTTHLHIYISIIYAGYLLSTPHLHIYIFMLDIYTAPPYQCWISTLHLRIYDRYLLSTPHLHIYAGYLLSTLHPHIYAVL